MINVKSFDRIYMYIFYILVSIYRSEEIANGKKITPHTR